MSIDYECQQTLGIMAGTLAQWLRDNRDTALDTDDMGLGDADAFGMYTMATGFLRMYKELIDLGVIKPPTVAGTGRRQ